MVPGGVGKVEELLKQAAKERQEREAKTDSAAADGAAEVPVPDINAQWDKSNWTPLHLACQAQVPVSLEAAVLKAAVLKAAVLKGEATKRSEDRGRLLAAEQMQKYREAGAEMEKLLRDAGTDDTIRDRDSLLAEEYKLAESEDTQSADPGWNC